LLIPVVRSANVVVTQLVSATLSRVAHVVVVVDAGSP
jgi:hypothetical protein